MVAVASRRAPAWLLAVAIMLVGAPALPAAEPFTTPVWQAGVDGYHTYRIPALLVTRDETLLAFCEGRKDNARDHGDIDLLVKRSTDGGRSWSSQQIVYEEGGSEKITIGNPCPVVDQSTGTIWLPLTRDNDACLLTYSTDDGRSWAAPRDITADVKRPEWSWYAMGPGVGIQIQQGRHAGRLVIPCDHKTIVDGRLAFFSHCIYSDDHGQSWRLGDPVGPHTNECQVVESPAGELLINMRNYAGRNSDDKANANRRAVARSRDGGQTWTDFGYDATLVEPVCQASLIALPKTDQQQHAWLLFSNPPHPNQRADLTVRLSRDGGQTWPVARQLHAGPSAYSCLARLPDGQIGCLYEAGQGDNFRQTITFARFPLEWLTAP